MPKTIKELREMMAQLEITVRRLGEEGNAVEFQLGNDHKLIRKAISSHRGQLAGVAPSDDEINSIFTRYVISPEATKKANAEHPLDMQAALPAAAIEGDEGLAAAIAASNDEYDAHNVRQVAARLSDIDAAIQASLHKPEHKMDAELEYAKKISLAMHNSLQYPSSALTRNGDDNIEAGLIASKQTLIIDAWTAIDQLSVIIGGGAAGGGDIELLQEKLFVTSERLNSNDPDEQVVLAAINSILYR